VRKRIHLAPAVLIAVMGSGCMVGPNYKRPAVQTPATYRDLSANPQLQTQTASYADLPWWHSCRS
jgi:outer membrane protein, multidrug efflux system